MPRKRKSNDFYNNEEVQSNSLFDSPAFNTDTADNVKNDTVKEGTSLTDTAYKNAETTSVNQENSSHSSEAVTFTEVTETAAIETAEETTDKKKKKKVSKSSTESIVKNISSEDGEDELLRKNGGNSILDAPEKENSVFKELFSGMFVKKPKQAKKKTREKIKPEEVKRYYPEIDKGLTSEQAEERYFHYLDNDDGNKYSKSYASIFVKNIFTFFNLLGLIVTIALIVANAPLSSFFFDIIYLLNIAIGIIQEIRSKKSIEKLSLISAKTANVIRDGVPVEIPSADIVLDDIVLYSIGNQILTDSVIVEGDVEVNESLLTGEPVAIKKTVGDKLFAGSFVTSGKCITQAIKVGKDNYVQKLSARAKKYKRPNSELMRSLAIIISCIGLIIPFIAALNIVKSLSPFHGLTWEQVQASIMNTSGLIIGMIPSGMFLLSSMALAVGVIRLARHNTLVQDLYSLEMLARVDVLCLDKTGTITDGRMKVNDCILLNNTTEYTISEIMGSMLSSLKDNNQTSTALYQHFGHSNALTASRVLPFSSKRKLSAVTFREVGTFAYGAPEFVLKEIPDKLKILIKQYASMGLRVLALGYSKSSITDNEDIPSTMKPIAIITIADNIRENAAQTIEWFKQNDVALKVISGDNPVTVSEIARKVGVPDADKYISLEGMSERDVIAIAEKYTVFGRVSPEQKAILVKQLKIAGHNVAMTGDGVNDILAMKEADCAVALASGSDATRNIAHLVLTDNNFNSMPQVVREGRRVINNVQNSASLYLMKTLFTMIFSIIMLILPGSGYPLETRNMFLLEMFVIGIPSFFMSLQPNDKRVKGNFINYVISKSLPCALLMVLSCILIYISQLFLKDSLVAAGMTNVDDVFQSLMIYAITFSGVIMLYRICSPFDTFRGILFSICFVCIIVATMLALYNGSSIIGSVALVPLKDYWSVILIDICVILLDIPLSSRFDALGSYMRNGSQKKKEK
ncbi:MAG TPA: ATPase P [Clostridiales bacterium]|nr:ATPase P [Clostridiales bacterium]